MKRQLIALIGIICFLAPMSDVIAQDTPILQCGDIVEGEVSADDSPEFARVYSANRRGDYYTMNISAGTRINLTVVPLGDTFNVAIALTDQGDNDVVNANASGDGQSESFTDMQLASSNQRLRVMGARPGVIVEPGPDITLGSIYEGNGGSDSGFYFGGYQIRIGCTLRNGTVIEPGDSLTQEEAAQPVVVAPPSFGFPGLPPVDFASAFRLPLTLSTPNQGEIPTSGDAVLGFRFDGTAGDIVNLSFERTSGNLNLGIVVLSDGNQVAYMAALVTSQSMASRFSLPATGEYTIGVFRIGLIPPETPEATSFTVTATLNP